MAVLQDLNAALDMAEANEKNQKQAFSFFVKNVNSGSKVDFFATGENWLIQVLEGTAKDLGLDPKAKTFFSNDEGQSTSDSNLSLAEFGIKEGSVLTIHQDAGVAAKK